MQRIFITHPLPQDALAPAEEAGIEVHMAGGNDPVDSATLRSQAQTANALITFLLDPVPAGALAGTGVRCVSNVAVGYDNIDVAGLSKLGIAVCHTPDVLTEATADVAFLLLLACARRFRSAEAALRGGRWGRWRLDLFCGDEIAGRTLGIVGFGRIGQAVARRALGFGMNLLVTWRTPHPERLPQGARSVSLETLLAESDFVSLHVPLTPKTRHLIDRKRLSLMKPTATLINTARGDVVDEQALVEALSSGRMRAAGLDVYHEEPIAPDHPLLGLPNVTALPHIGSATFETRSAMARLAVENAVRFLQGAPQHTVAP